MGLRVQSLALLSGVRIWCCCELWCGLQCGLDLVLLWLWHGPVAAALIRPLAWEPPYVMGAALEKKKKKRKKKKNGGREKGKDVNMKNEEEGRNKRKG